MKVEILFHTASSPKMIDDVVSVYTKDALLCIQRENGLIIKYPLLNIFQIAHMHGGHAGSAVEEKLPI